MKLKSYLACLFAGLALMLSSCDDYLDINKNPNNPDQVEAALLLAPIQNQYALGIQSDARFVGRYVQNWQSTTSGDVWDLHGYTPASDNGGDIWRSVYWRGGRNNINLVDDARAGQKWDYLGVGLIYQAWGWQMLTDQHGEIILDEAYDLDPNKNVFNYNTQPEAYAKTVQLLNEAIQNLNRGDGKVSQSQLARGDLIYKGDRTKWKRFAYGLLAINAHHQSRKSTYDANKVIQYVDSAFVSNADDALLTFNGTNTSDASFFGPIRQNLQVYAQSAFMVRLLDGTVFGGVKDPRLSIMLAPSLDGTYRGLAPGQGQSTATTVSTAIRTVTPWGTPVNVAPALGSTTGRFIFTDKGPFPMMTYAQLQFIKAEAAFIKGDKATALAAYRRGIEAHMTSSFVNVTSATDRTAYLSSTAVVPATAAALTLSQIMTQKYIAQWGWGFLEQWTDLRRYDYSGDVFTSFALPNNFSTSNNGKPVQRLRPRYNSEYIWNIPALTKIGGLELDFHTKPLWLTQP